MRQLGKKQDRIKGRGDLRKEHPKDIPGKAPYHQVDLQEKEGGRL